MSMQYPLVVGGAGGIGRAIALVLASRPEVRRVDIVDRAPLAPIADETAGAEKLAVHRFDLESGDFSFFDRFVQGDTDGLFITAGFGRLALFEELDEAYIERSFTVNSVAPIRIVRRFYGRLLAATPFPCAVMVSIAGFMSSPFFSIYGATKAALKSSSKVSTSNSNVPARPIVCSMFRPVRSREPDFRAARPISN